MGSVEGAPDIRSGKNDGYRKMEDSKKMTDWMVWVCLVGIPPGMMESRGRPAGRERRTMGHGRP